MDKRLVKIGEAARLLSTDPVTLRKWESTGELLPIIIHKGDQPMVAASGIQAGFLESIKKQ